MPRHSSPRKRRTLWIGAIIAVLGSVLVGGGLVFYEWLRPPLVTPNGYTDRTSYEAGDTVLVYLSAESTSSEETVRLANVFGQTVDSVRASVALQQPATDEPWREGFGYEPSFEYVIPDNLPSGVYLWEGIVPFVVRASTEADSIVVVYPSNTIAAYNMAGGKSLYVASRWRRAKQALRNLLTFQWNSLIPEPSETRSNVVSFHRPGGLTHWETFRPFLRWISAREDVSFIADRDLDSFEKIEAAKLLVIMGHSEYWTRDGRRTFDRHVQSGKPALVLSGNTMWWQVRYDAPHQLACYRKWDLDPADSPLKKTVVWNDERLEYPIWRSIGAQFNLGGFGLRSQDAGWDGYRIVSAQSPLIAGAGVGTDSVISAPTTEYDGTFIAYFDDQNHPVADTAKLGFHRFDLVGYDLAYYHEHTVGTFIAFQATPTSGIVVNAGSMDWCGERVFSGRDSAAVRVVTKNAIELLLAGESVFPSRQQYR